MTSILTKLESYGIVGVLSSLITYLLIKGIMYLWNANKQIEKETRNNLQEQIKKLDLTVKKILEERDLERKESKKREEVLQKKIEDLKAIAHTLLAVCEIGGSSPVDLTDTKAKLKEIMK